MRVFLKTGIASLALIVALAGPAFARDAAFMDPGSGGGGDEAIHVEPKGDIDTGETTLGVAKRITLFFVNQTGFPVQLDKITLNSDGNVAAELSNDDCTKQGTLAAQSRCSVEVSVTPSSAGAWSVDVIMTHNGAGRIARGKISGKTAGAGEEKKENGLSFSGKDTTPVSFGEVRASGGKAVRSALMVNDSTDPITIYSIDVVEADNGLKRLDQGCAVDMQLKPGESCPVTLLWAPTDRGEVSTDLIIRHSGRLGFSVIPIRGKTTGAASSSTQSEKPAAREDVSYAPRISERDISPIPTPPSAPQIEQAVEKVTSSALALSPDAGLRLIGTVGNRGIFLRADGTTTMAGANDPIDTGIDGGKPITVIAISMKSADIMVGEKRKTLRLEASPELISKAASTRARQSQPTMPTSAAVPATYSPSSALPSVTSTAPSPSSTVPTSPPNISGTGGVGGTR